MEEKDINKSEEIEEISEEEISEKKILDSKRYSVPLDMFEEAYTVFQNKYVYPRNLIMSAVLIILAIANIINIVMKNSGTMGYILVFACLALAVINIYNPKKIKRNLLESIKEIGNDVYTLDVYNDKMVIGTVINPVIEGEERQPEEYEEVFGEIEAVEEIQPSEVFINSNLRVIERKNFFLVYIKKSMFYVIPKNIFNDEEISSFAMYFSERIGNCFICQADK